jgi:hypothetical protein
VLGLHPPNLSARLVSGGNAIDRPLSSGKQIFYTDKSKWPLNQPVPKLEAIAQCSGEDHDGCNFNLNSPFIT